MTLPFLRARTVLVLPALVLFGALHCAELSPIVAGTCGNGVYEPETEACDTFGKPDKAGTPCLPPSAGPGRACELDCSSGPCPQGFGCDVDTKICHEPRGDFGPPGPGFPAGANIVSLGDIDGDGRQDALTQSAEVLNGVTHARLHYFGPTGAREDERAIPRGLTAPSLADADGDGKEDVIFGSNNGIGVLRGNQERDLEPVPFAALDLSQLQSLDPIRGYAGTALFTAPALLAADPSTPPAQPVLVTVTANALLLTLAATSGAPQPDVTLAAQNPEGAPLPILVSGRHRAPLQLRSPPVSACGEVAVVSPDGGRLWIVSPCESTSIKVPANPPRQEFTFPVNPVRGAFIGDADGDGKDDLLLASAPGGNDAVSVDVVYGGRPVLTLDRNVIKVSGRVLATGDFNGDKIVDFVTPTAVWVSVPATRNYLATMRPAVALTVAAVGDFTGDGIADIIGGHGLDPFAPAAPGVVNVNDLDLFVGTPSGTFVATTIATDQAVFRLLVSDLDADGIDDVAFAQSAVNGATIRVLFGTRGGVPSLTTSFGRQPTAPTLVDIGRSVGDGTTGEQPRLAVLANRKFFVALGGADRLLLSPLTPATTGPVVEARAVIAGSTKTSGSAVCGVFAAKSEARGKERATTFLCSSAPPRPDGSAVDVFETFKPLFGRPGQAELGAGSPSAVATPAGRSPEEAVYGVKGSLLVDLITKKAFELGSVVAAEPRLAFEDLDGDGNPDAVLSVVAASKGLAVLVAWGAPDGTFSAPTIVDGSAGPVAGFAFARLTAYSNRKTLLTLRTGKNDIMRHDLAGRTFTSRVVVSGRAASLPDAPAAGGGRAASLFSDPTDLAAGDVNGDGLDDLVVVDARSLRVLLGLDRRAR